MIDSNIKLLIEYINTDMTYHEFVILNNLMGDNGVTKDMIENYISEMVEVNDYNRSYNVEDAYSEEEINKAIDLIDLLECKNEC